MAKAGKPNPPIDNVRTQCWSITIPLEHSSLEDVTKLFTDLSEGKGFSGCFSEEEGSKEREDGTHYRHAQAAVHFAGKKTGKQLKTIFAETKAHIEPAKNTAALIKYVQKSDTHVSGPYKFGAWEELEKKNQNQGKRKDLDLLEEAILSGKTFTEIMNDSTLNQSLDRHRRWAVDRLNAFKCGKFEWERRGIDEHGMMLSCDYIFGESGLAKTTTVQDFFGLKNCFTVTNYSTGFPFDLYSGQEVLILDEFKGELPFKELLQIMQGAPYRCNIKGGGVWAAWKKVVIISSVPPLAIYLGLEKGDGRRKQFWRRLSEGVVINAEEQPLADFYPYDTPEDAFNGVTRMPKGIKGYGPEYWEAQRANLPKERKYEYTDVTKTLSSFQLQEIGYNPDEDEEDDEW